MGIGREGGIVKEKVGEKDIGMGGRERKEL